MTELCEAYVVAMEAIASRIPERPLPKGINEVEAGDWTLAVNTTGEPLPYGGSELPPYEVLAQHKVYFVIAGFGPGGGVIAGGLPEGEFIEQMRALASCDTHPKDGDASSAAPLVSGAVGAEGDETPNTTHVTNEEEGE